MTDPHSHSHSHPHPAPGADSAGAGAGGPERFDQEFWDDRYRTATALWSGNPNRHLVAEAAGLSPGSALELGAGEGADAIWLAGKGWEITAVDISAVALERAAGNAARVGPAIAGRVRWLRRGLLTWRPPEATYDLVSAQYLHLPPEPRQQLFDALARSVAPGGTLLIVGHHPSDVRDRHPMPELFFTGDDIADCLDPGGWAVVTNGAPEHTTTDADGQPVTGHDTVFRARRP
ncbi:MAG TPA: class I SAM-dependent methyltransferase [Acidimicrobiales bacterium]|jgi:SAM-dependent methyltransferase|nr:class I SAM-dependent methyltransferase [Acidimicrobiales bacterium]